MKFIVNLMPLLQASQFPAHVISVFAAGKEGDLFLDDLSMRDPKHYSMITARSHVTYMHTFFLEHLAAQNPGKLSLVHVFPGLVMTAAFKNPGVPLWFKAVWTIASPIIRLLTTPISEAGDRILFLASPVRFPARQITGGGPDAKIPLATGPKLDVAVGSDLKVGSGAYAVGISGEAVDNAKAYERYRQEGVGEKLVAHTLKAFEDIQSGKVFTD
jgi:hypothetical protein